jgi:hypothetical protein
MHLNELPVHRAWRAACMENTVPSYTKFIEVWPTLDGPAKKEIKELNYPPHVRKLVSRLG